MKLILVVSLIVNLAAGVFFAARPEEAPLGWRDFFSRHFHLDTIAQKTGAPTPIATAASPKLWPLLASRDLRTFIARLRAAGFSPEMIRSLVHLQVSAIYSPQLRALHEPDPNLPFWKQPSTFYTIGDPRYGAQEKLQKERAKLLHDLLGNEDIDAEFADSRGAQFGPMPVAKIVAVQRITDDYSEMAASVRAASGGVMLKEDRDKLALVAQEQHADLAAILSPDELAEYEMRSSPLTASLRNRLDLFDPNQAEFTAIFRAEQTANDKLPGNVASNDLQQRRTVQAELADQLRADLGDARYADLIRAGDFEYQQLSQIAARNNISPDVTSQAYNVRAQAATQSNQIYNDSTLTNDQKRAALLGLAVSTQAQLTSTLGSAAAAYLQVAQRWLDPLRNGGAVTFDANPPLLINNGQSTISYGNGMELKRVPQTPATR